MTCGWLGSAAHTQVERNVPALAMVGSYDRVDVGDLHNGIVLSIEVKTWDCSIVQIVQRTGLLCKASPQLRTLLTWGCLCSLLCRRWSKAQ